MDKKFNNNEYLKKLIEGRKKIILTMNDQRTYTGFIVGVSKNSFLFMDKFNQEILFYINDIRRILVTNGEEKIRGEN